MLLNGAVMLNQPRQHHVGSAEALDFGEPIPASRGGKKIKRRQLGLHNHVQIACIYIYIYLFTYNTYYTYIYGTPMRSTVPQGIYCTHTYIYFIYIYIYHIYISYIYRI